MTLILIHGAQIHDNSKNDFWLENVPRAQLTTVNRADISQVLYVEIQVASRFLDPCLHNHLKQYKW
jgi:hypothetical protein